MKLLGTPSDRDLQAMRASCCADDLPKLKPFPWDRVFPPGTHPDAIDLAQRLLRYDPDQRLTASQTLAHPFFDGAQQLVEGSDASNQGGTAGAAMAPRASASEWEHRFNRSFDELAAEGAQLPKLVDTILRRFEQIGMADQPPPAVAQQVVSVARQELSSGLKLRAEAVRSVQKRMLLEAQQLQLTFPLEAPAEPPAAAASTEAKEIEAQIAELASSAREGAERSEADKAQLLEAISLAKAKLAGESEHRADGGQAERREAATQTEEDGRTTTPGFGRRAGAPTRQNTILLDHQMAAASPLSQRADGRPQGSGAPTGMTVQTDNLGQVTPLASFSPSVPPGGAASDRSSPLTRTGSAGRRSSAKAGEEPQNSS